MSEQINLQAYIASLPEIETARLPLGTLFTARNLIYQVIETGTGGFRKARQWRMGEDTDVALVQGSYLANFLPLIVRGRLLPVYPSRTDLLEHNSSVNYLFITEQTALDTAYLDAALVQSGDVYVRNHNREAAFAITDGLRVFRLYYYDRSASGRPVHQEAAIKTIQFRPFHRGPMYWRLLSSWPRMASWMEETLPHIPPVE